MIEMTPHSTCICPSCAHCYASLNKLPSDFPLPVSKHHDDCVHCAAFRRAVFAALDTVEVDPAIWEASFTSKGDRS
jgi:hypothetical protein